MKAEYFPEMDMQGKFVGEDMRRVKEWRHSMENIFRSSQDQRVVRMRRIYASFLESGIYPKLNKVLAHLAEEKGKIMKDQSFDLTGSLREEWEEESKKKFMTNRNMPDSPRVEFFARQSVVADRDDILPIMQDVLQIEFMHETVEVEGVSREGSVFAHYMERASKRIEEWERSQREEVI